METLPKKIKTKVNAEIINSNTRMFTVAIKVTDEKTGDAVTKGKVEIRSRDGKVIGTGKISKDGTTEITTSITRKNYVLTIHYEGTQHTYGESETKINFKKEYMFYKTSFYLWISIITVLIILMYIDVLNLLILSPTSIATFTQYGINFLPHITMISQSIIHIYLRSLLNIFSFIINILVWILIISFIIASVYATQFNSNYHNIIRKNVMYHSIFKNYFTYIFVILMTMTILAIISGYCL